MSPDQADRVDLLGRWDLVGRAASLAPVNRDHPLDPLDLVDPMDPVVLAPLELDPLLIPRLRHGDDP